MSSRQLEEAGCWPEGFAGALGGAGDTPIHTPSVVSSSLGPGSVSSWASIPRRLNQALDFDGPKRHPRPTPGGFSCR